MPNTPPSPAASPDDPVRRLLWRNYLANSIEGGIYIGGMAFLSPESVMPTMVASLGAPNWVIALMPMMMLLGSMWPPLLTAHWVESLPRVRPFCMVAGLVQRIPYLFAGLALLFLGDSHPQLVLAVVAFAPFASGIALGVSVGAWMELVSRIIPAERRASSWAIRYGITALIGVSAGSAVRSILTRYPGTTGYGILHMIAFGFLMLSYAVFAMIREPDVVHETAPSTRGLRENLRDLPDVLRRDAPFRRFIWTRVLGIGIYVMTPFLAIHARAVLGKPEAYVGYLVMVQMAGGVCGNAMAAVVGDKCGSKVVMMIARVLLVIVSVLAVFNGSEPGFLLIFFLLGFGYYADKVAGATLSVDICPEGRRPTYLSLLMTIVFPGMLVAAGVSTLIRETSDTLAPAAMFSAVTLALSLVFLARVPEPRRR